MSTTTQWALLWSASQNALHIETVEAMLSNGRAAYRDNRPTDYVPLYIGAEADCRGAADASRGLLHTRATLREIGKAA